MTNFSLQCDIFLFVYRPIDCWGVELEIPEQEVLLSIIIGIWGFFRPSMQQSRVDRTVLTVSHEELGIRVLQVYAHEGGYVELAVFVGDDLEEVVVWLFKVMVPTFIRDCSRLWQDVFYHFSYDFCFDIGKNFFEQWGRG